MASNGFTVDLAAVPTLPADASLAYLAEGAANIIYRISHPSLGSPAPSLLRVRKTLPSSQPNLLAYTYLSSTAFPLFPPSLLVKSSLIRLPSGFLAAANASLRHEPRRPEKRRSLLLEENEEFALLVADMSPHGPHQVLVEFKPKWLVQSPSAPEGWTRCRTCALRDSRGAGKKGFCPLDVASQEPARVRRAVEAIITAGNLDEVVDVVVEFLCTSELMLVLKTLQQRLDPDGPLNSKMGPQFLDAMTVRDLTVFLRVDVQARTVECGIGDLDMKSKDGGKEEYWRLTERKLVEEGWYEGKGCDMVTRCSPYGLQERYV